LNGNQPRDGYASAGDDDFLARRHWLNQTREMGLGFMDVHFHESQDGLSE
jgi:hypothetical protein